MKILELHLKAFGPFTDRRLDLSSGQEGLHIIYGENEAGKSSALRALRALLYGIPERTRDAFLHPARDLRIGGRLRNSDGTEISILRRKGRKNTLLSPEDERALADGVLDRFLQGVSADVFRTLFGIDHDELVRGGQAILEQEGEVGQALFSAALGTVNLRRILQDLQENVDALFKPRGSNPKINRALADYKNARKAIKDASLSGRVWLVQHNAVVRATKELVGIDKDLLELKGERNRLERLGRALPRLARRGTVLERLKQLGEVVALPAGFGERRRNAMQTLMHQNELLTKCRDRRERLQEEANGLEIPEPILEQAEIIERLHQELGAQRKAVRDRQGLEARRRQYRNDARALLRGIHPELDLGEAESLRPVLANRKRIDALAQQHEARIESRSKARNTVEEIDEQIAAIGQSLESMPPPDDPSALRRVVQAARKAGNVDSALAEARATVTQGAEQARVDLEGLGLWNGSLEVLEALPVPPGETIDRFDDAFQELKTRSQDLESRIQRARKDLADTDRELEALRLAIEVPTEEDLTRSLEHRDAGWALLKRRWIRKEDVAREARAYSADQELHDAYEQNVGTSDEVGDRLRREADRVHRQAELTAHKNQLEQRLEDLEAQAAGAAKESEQLQQKWKEVWEPCNIDPLPPREMRPWIRKHEALRSQVANLRHGRRRVEDLEAVVRGYAESLTHGLEGLGEKDVPVDGTLELLLTRGEDLIQTIEAREAEHKELNKELSRLQRQLAKAREVERAAIAALEEWREDWKRAVKALGLSADSKPSEATDALGQLADFFARIDDAEEVGKRIFAIDKDAEEFEEEVRAFAERVAPDLAVLPAEEIVVKLNAALTRAREDDARMKNLRKQIQTVETEIAEAEATIEAMEKRLAELRKAAGCQRNEELEQAEERSDEHHELKQDLADIEDQLLQEGEGLTVGQLAEEAEAVDRDALPGELEQIGRRIQELEDSRLDLYETRSREQTILESMGGAAEAAEAAERAEGILARLRADVEQYLRVRVASMILEREMERYRAENQDPVLRRSGELFTRLTLSSFVGLQTDFDEKDEPVLVGVRDDDEKVQVAGLSDGTCDQLYLALRLATIEKYVATSEPLPFVIDDVLIGFDDGRSKAALEVLTEIAARTQVIVFSHHSRIVELAKKIESEVGVFVHDLQ